MAKSANSGSVSIQPLGDRVVVMPFPKDEVTASGILIPDSAKQEKPGRGTVVAVGAGRYDGDELVPMTVKVGDTVLFSKYGYDEVKIDGKIDGKEYFILSETNVLAIINN